MENWLSRSMIRSTGWPRRRRAPASLAINVGTISAHVRHTDLAYADTLRKSADALRGQADAEYKHVMLGLLENRDDYIAARVLRVPAEGYWQGVSDREHMPCVT